MRVEAWILSRRLWHFTSAQLSSTLGCVSVLWPFFCFTLLLYSFNTDGSIISLRLYCMLGSSSLESVNWESFWLNHPGLWEESARITSGLFGTDGTVCALPFQSFHLSWGISKLHSGFQEFWWLTIVPFIMSECLEFFTPVPIWVLNWWSFTKWYLKSSHLCFSS